MVVHVGDLELAASRGLELGDHVEDVGLVAVEAGDRESAGRLDRLLDDLRDPAVLDARDAEMTEMLGLAHVREQNPRSGALPSEVVDRRRDRTPEDVVGEHHDDALVADELAGKPERLRDSAGTLLIAVLEPVAEEPPEVVHVLAPGHQHQLR